MQSQNVKTNLYSIRKFFKTRWIITKFSPLVVYFEHGKSKQIPFIEFHVKLWRFFPSQLNLIWIKIHL